MRLGVPSQDVALKKGKDRQKFQQGTGGRSEIFQDLPGTIDQKKKKEFDLPSSRSFNAEKKESKRTEMSPKRNQGNVPRTPPDVQQKNTFARKPKEYSKHRAVRREPNRRGPSAKSDWGEYGLNGKKRKKFVGFCSETGPNWKKRQTVHSRPPTNRCRER